MIRKFITSLIKIGSAVAIFPTLCAAQSSFSLPPGIFLGAAVSGSSTTMHNQLTFDPREVEHASLYNRSLYGNTTQVQPGFILGYEYIFDNRWLFGAEFQANYLKSYINASGSDYISNTVTANNQYALQVRLGTNLTKNDDFVYLLAGVARTEADIKIIFDNTNLTVGALGDLQLGAINSTHQLSGLKLGLGYEKHLNNNLGLRIDYSHTQYGSFLINLNDPAFANIMPALGTSKVSQSTDMINVSLIVIS